MKDTMTALNTNIIVNAIPKPHTAFIIMQSLALPLLIQLR
jgi:hypothetical protein